MQSSFCYNCSCSSCDIARRNQIYHEVQRLISDIRTYGSMLIDFVDPVRRDRYKMIVRRLRNQLDMARVELATAEEAVAS